MSMLVTKAKYGVSLFLTGPGTKKKQVLAREKKGANSLSETLTELSDIYKQKITLRD